MFGNSSSLSEKTDLDRSSASSFSIQISLIWKKKSLINHYAIQSTLPLLIFARPAVIGCVFLVFSSGDFLKKYWTNPDVGALCLNVIPFGFGKWTDISLAFCRRSFFVAGKPVNNEIKTKR